MCIPRIIDDLIPVILETNDRHWWPRDLQRLALVSPGWLGPVRRRLYSCPTIHTFFTCRLLSRTLSNNPHLRLLVHGIDLRPASDLHQVVTAEDMSSLRYILSLPGLQSVVLGGHLAVCAEQYLHMMPYAHSITSLSISGQQTSGDQTPLHQQHSSSLEWNEVIAFKFTNLKRLRLTNLSLTIAPPSLPYTMSIEDIAFDNVAVVDGMLFDMLQDSWNTIRTFSVSAKASLDQDEQLRWTLESCEKLEKLHYELRDCLGQGIIFSDEIPPLPSLRQLHLMDVNLNPQSLLLIKERLSSLEELSVSGRTLRISSNDWANFVQSGLPTSLRSLHTSAGTNVPPFAHWTKEMKGQVAEACHSKGIKFTCV
ncbi:hypothetical protein C8Q75DRAFT_735110 [Abortiporus biennis]|nr:hypothetical protein C8Q75DRAFT_735110 [Abortiporus biennis]